MPKFLDLTDQFSTPLIVSTTSWPLLMSMLLGSYMHLHMADKELLNKNNCDNSCMGEL